MSDSTITARTTIIIVAPFGQSAALRREVQKAARLAWERHVRGSDWDCRLADCRCEESADSDADHWQVGCVVEIDEDGSRHDDGALEHAIHARIEELCADLGTEA